MNSKEGMITVISFNTKAYLENLENQTNRKFGYYKAIENGNWKEWQEAFRMELRQITGLDKVESASKGVPIKPKIEEVKQYPNFTREKIYITTEPGIEIAFYLLLPKDQKGPFPLVLTPHGHGRRGKEIYVGNYVSESEKQEALGGDRDVALQAVAEGYAVIAMDVRGFWEMARMEELTEKKNNSCTELQKNAFLYGRTLIGERVHDMGRLIDYASTRSEIDTSRIAITGNSGGGTVSLFTGALDERITVCAPSAYFCTFAASIVSINHCLCNFVPGILEQAEMYDIVGLIAPRPILFVNGRYDPIFPIEDTKASFRHVQKIYNHFNAKDHCELFIGITNSRSGHLFENICNFYENHHIPSRQLNFFKFYKC